MAGEQRRKPARTTPWQPPAAFNTVATLVVLAGAVGLAWLAWNYYEYAPWTRDGRVRVYTVQVAPEVSGTVVEMAVQDNQYVRKGDVLFRIDPRTFENTVKQATGALGQAKSQASYLAAEAKRRQALSDLSESNEDRQNTTGIAQSASDAVLAATGSLDQASLNVERSVIRSPVNGWVTNLLMQPGGYASEGKAALTLVDADSFWIEAYYEETQIPRIKPGDPVAATLLAYPGQAIRGRVSGLGRGIEVTDANPGVQGLPAVNPVFTWVRLAQRIPVRVDLVDVPCPIVLSSGLTATVTVLDGTPPVLDANGRRGRAAGRSCGPQGVAGTADERH